MSEEKKHITLKAYSKKELSQIYEVDRKTFNKWLVPFEGVIGEQNGRYFSIPQVRIIFDKLGLPCNIVVEP